MPENIVRMGRQSSMDSGAEDLAFSSPFPMEIDSQETYQKGNRDQRTFTAKSHQIAPGEAP